MAVHRLAVQHGGLDALRRLRECHSLRKFLELCVRVFDFLILDWVPHKRTFAMVISGDKKSRVLSSFRQNTLRHDLGEIHVVGG